ncbi:hypothetical protein YC2023_059863 [Brassica napus]
MPSGTQKPQHNVELFNLARLPNASNNMCFLNITISLYDYSLSRSTSDGYDAFSREDSDQVRSTNIPTSRRKNSEPTCRRIQATYRPDPRTTISGSVAVNLLKLNGRKRALTIERYAARPSKPVSTCGQRKKHSEKCSITKKESSKFYDCGQLENLANDSPNNNTKETCQMFVICN